MASRAHSLESRLGNSLRHDTPIQNPSATLEVFENPDTSLRAKKHVHAIARTPKVPRIMAQEEGAPVANAAWDLCDQSQTSDGSAGRHQPELYILTRAQCAMLTTKTIVVRGGFLL